MKKVQYYEYGGPEVMKMETVERPRPESDEVLVKVYAAGINELDWKIRNGNLKIQDGKGFPKAMGCELAGEVIQTGSDAGEFTVGDAVFGWIPFSRLGGFAEYAVVKKECLHSKPSSLSHVQAAALPMVGTTALQALTKEVKLAPGQRVLVNGSTGGVGHFAVQIARATGANVTAVTGTSHVDFAKELGADSVVDYHQSDVSASEERYDVILDTSKKLPWEVGKKLLNEGGTYIDLQPGLKAFVGSFLQNAFSDKTHDVLGVAVEQEDLKELASLVNQGDITVTVGQVFDFSDFVNALISLESGAIDMVGKAVFKMAD